MFYDVDTKKIDKLAHLSIKRGVALQKGQNLLITAPLESLPLVRKIAEYAYKEGAGLVTPLFNDSDITLSRFKYGNDESFNVEMNTGTSRSYAVVIKLLSGYFDFFLLMFPKTLQNSAVVNGLSIIFF